MKYLRNRRLSELLPWYINGTLDQQERRDVEEWLDGKADIDTKLEEWRIYYQLIQLIPQEYPSNQVVGRIRNNIKAHRSPPSKFISGFSWGFGGILALAAILVLWITIQPGLVLRWKVEGNIPEVFRVYRNTSDRGEYEFVSEIETLPFVTEYEYIDSQILFSGEYHYRVEGLYETESSFVSQSISGSYTNILLVQIIIIITSLLFGIAAAIYLQSYPIVSRPQNHQLSM